MQTVSNENIYTAWGMYNTTNSVIDIARENHALATAQWNTNETEWITHSSQEMVPHPANLPSYGQRTDNITTTTEETPELRGYHYTTNLASAMSQAAARLMGVDYRGYGTSGSAIAGAIINKRNERIAQGIENSKQVKSMRRMK